MLLLATLDRLRADLDALRPLAPEQEARVLQKFRLEWNYNSNAIEGNSLTLGETRSLLLHGLTAAGKPMRDHLDIKGHNEAVLWLEDFVRDERPLTEQFIRGMHEVLLGEPYYTPAQSENGQPTRKLIQPGRYKTSPNNVLTATGEMFYFASPEDTPARMTDLVNWYRAEEAAPTMPPVALAAEFHYRFVRIHPFDDGNGRMSRLLMNLILLRHGYPMTVIKADDRNRYLAALAEADAGEPEPFLRFIIENVEASLRLMIRAAQGESIDEPSDLDKKLAVLKTEINKPKGINTLKWTLALQAQTWRDLLKPWFLNLSNLLGHIDGEFINSGINLTLLLEVPTQDLEFTGGRRSLQANKRPFLPEALLIGDSLENDEMLHDVVYFNFDWMNLERANRIFGCALRLRFGFGKWNWEVSFRVVETTDAHSPEWQKLVESPYQMEYDELRMVEINQRLVQEVHDFIAAKVVEAD